MHDYKIINLLTLFPSKHWKEWYENRQIFNCEFDDLEVDKAKSVADVEHRKQHLEIICHNLQNMGDIKLKLLSVQLKRYIYSIYNLKTVKRTKIDKEFTKHNDKLLKTANDLFMNIYHYVEEIKTTYEKLYKCSIRLEPPKDVFERFLNHYFSNRTSSLNINTRN